MTTAKMHWYKERRMVGKCINRLRVKGKHSMMINDTMTYGEYKIYIRTVINSIRPAIGFDYLTVDKFDEAWQYTVMAHEKWSIAYREIINVIYGNW